ASLWGKAATRASAGTMTVPPPMPKRPEVNPAITPTSTTRSQGRSRAGAAGSAPVEVGELMQTVYSTREGLSHGHGGPHGAGVGRRHPGARPLGHDHDL